MVQWGLKRTSRESKRREPLFFQFLMNDLLCTNLRFSRSAVLATVFTASWSVVALAKDTIYDINMVLGPIEVPPLSIGDFAVGGPYTGPGGATVDTIDLIVGASGLAEWWVNDNQTDPWTSVVLSGTQFAYHNRTDIPDGGFLFAAWSLGSQYYDYTSSFRHTDGQLPLGSIISFGLSDSGMPYGDDWGDVTFTGMSDADAVGGLNPVGYEPALAYFSGAAAFKWRSYEVTSIGSDLIWNIKTPPEPLTDYVVFVELPDGEEIDADGRSFDGTDSLSDLQMAGGGLTDEIVFNWTIDAKNDLIGVVNTAFGENIGVAKPLGDFVWVDLDRDGVQDPLEPGLEGVLVELLNAGGNPVLDSNSQPFQTTTNANGAYGIEEFPAGDYTLRFTPPDGQFFTATGMDQGGDDVLDSDIDSSGVTASFSIAENESITTLDAGYLVPQGVIADFVFNDSNADGIQDVGELGIEGVTVNLLDESGNPVLDGGIAVSTTTNADGVYYFADLTPDTYIVEFVTPANYAATLQDVGGDDALDSDIDPSTGRTGQIVLGDETILTVDAGFYVLPSIGDFVFNDADGDGRQDEGEVGIPGVTVNLLDSTGNNVLATTVTDGAGGYLFEGLAPDGYIIEFVAPSGFGTVNQNVDQSTDDIGTDSDYDPMTGRTAVITVAPGEKNTDIDAGYKPPNKFAQIGDQVWSDLNRDGIKDGGDPGVPGVTVNLLDSTGNTTLVTTTTDVSGNYNFIVEPKLNYIIEFVPPSGFTVTEKDAGSDDDLDSDAGVSTFQTDLLYAGENDVITHVDVGLVPNVIGDTVWVDTNKDGIQDPGEPRLEGVLVELLNDAGTNAILDGSNNPITATTDVNGNYELSGFPLGTYTVRFTDPAGREPTLIDTGSDDAADSDINANGVTAQIDMTAPGSNLTVDAGYQPISPFLGDFVWNDLNANGVYDSGEPGLEGVTVNVLDGSGNPVLDDVSNNPISTVTSVTGGYIFDELAPGDYILEFIPPQDFGVSPQDQGSNDELDSDINPTTNRTGVYSLALGEESLTVDAGMFALGSIGDFVWVDEDGDGIQDPGEVGLPGVAVALLGGSSNPIVDGSGSPVKTTSDASGFYQFTDLPSGDYILDFSKPDGFVTVQQDRDQGSDDLSTDSDYDITNGQTAVITLGQGENNVDIDAGYEPPNKFAQLGSTVWSDLNGDGIQDPGEPGVVGVVVNLLDGSGSPILDGDGNATSVTTDANGGYLFIVDPGRDYILEFVPPTDTSFTLQGVGSDLALDSDVDPNTNKTAVIMVNNNEVNLDIDAGLTVPQNASLGDLVWNDANGDGIKDGGESGLAGVTVKLYDSSAALLGTEVTDSAGAYNFTGLAAGDYTVEFLPPSGYVLSPQDATGDTIDSDADPVTFTTATITLSVSENGDTIDAGMYRLAAIGNYVWIDENADGVQDAGESGIAGVTVELKDGAAVIATTTTDANGGYIFTDVVPGTYEVVVVNTTLPAGLSANPTYNEDTGTTAPDDTTAVTVAAGAEHLTADFGYNYASVADVTTPDTSATGAIGDRIWSDDGDGIQGANEPGIKGVTVSLLVDSNGDGVYGGAGDTAAVTTTTGPNGSYVFDNLAEGAYVIEVDITSVALTGLTQSGDPDGVLDDQSNPIALAPGDVYLNVDFGYTNPSAISIGDTVYYDVDGDGTKEPDGNDATAGTTADNETGIEGVTVALLDTSGDVVATDVTDANGSYLFPGLSAGVDYTVVVTDTDNVLAGLSNSGDPDGGAPDQSVVVAPAVDDLGQDFGYTPDGHSAGQGFIGDTVYLDFNGDNVPNPGEGLEGVTVELFSGMDLLATTTTDENGTYSFGGLDPAATYNVTVDTGTLPGGLTNSVDPDGGNDSESSVDLNASPGGLNADQDFGYVPAVPNTIAGTIWEDTNADGLLVETGTGIDGVTVNLYDASGDLVGTTTTSGGGTYSFGNLPDGNYIVDVTDTANVLDGMWHTIGADAGDGVTDNNSQFDTYSVDLDSAGANAAAVIHSLGDFGYYEDGAVLGDYVWLDADSDGVQEGSAGISNSLVTLTITYPNTETVTVTTLTDGSGNYSFGGLLADEQFNTATAGSSADPTYVVTFATPVGHTASPTGAGTAPTDSNGVAESSITLVQGQVDDTIDSGFFVPVGPVAISGSVYNDDEADGVSTGDAILPATVTLYTDPNGDGDPSDGVIVGSDSDGSFNFTGLPPGDYVLVETDPAGFGSSGDTSGLNDNLIPVDATAGDSTGNDFLDAPRTILGSIAGTVYEDDDDTNDFSSSDAPLAGVEVQLWADLNGNGQPDDGGQPLATTLTNTDGGYLFDDIVGGDYVVVEVTPAGLASLDDIDGTSVPNTVDEIGVSLPPGGDSVGNDFLDDNAPSGSISGSVLADDGSNDFTGTDVGIVGVEVQLWTDPNGDGDPSDGMVIDAVVTALDGTYLFSSLPLDDYVVLEIDPDGATSVTDADGTARPNTINEIGVELTVGTPDAVEQNFLDTAGLRAITGDVVNDVNGNAVDDAEPLLSGVTIGLWTDPDGDGNPDDGVLLGTTTTDGAADPSGGDYSFINVAPGNYVVIETDPSGYSSTGDVVGANDNEIPVDVTAADSSNNDFLDATTNLLGQISGNVYNDVNDSSTINGGDAPIAGVTVSLWPDDGSGNADMSGGTPIATVVTAPDGSYLFDEVPAGDYVIVESDPSGFTSVNGNEIPVTLLDGGTNTGNNFLDTTPDPDGSISGTVYNDTTDDDLLDNTNDTPVAGVTVGLWTDPNGDGSPDDGTEITNTQTDANGDYVFTNLPLGDYVVVESNPAGAISVTDVDEPNVNNTLDQIGVTLTSGAPDATEQDFLDESETRSISGDVIDDVNGNGVNDGESLLVGAVITLWTDPDGDGDPSDGTVVGTMNTDAAVDASGEDFSFTGLAPGTYVLVESDPSGFTSTADNGGINDNKIAVDLTLADAVNRDFLDTLPGSLASISGTVYVDDDTDSGFGVGDAPISGVTVQLWVDDGTGAPDKSAVVPVASTTTDNQGNYVFPDLSPGDYVVEEIDPAGATSVDDTEGGAMDNHIAVTLAANVDSTGNDFLDGNLTTNSISGTVFDDEDSDNVIDKDGTDTPVAGVVVKLYLDTNNNNTVDPGETAVSTVKTDTNGQYMFDNLPDGNYVLVEIDPGNAESRDDEAGTGGSDEDSGARADNQVAVDVFGGQDSIENDFLDAVDPAGYIYDSTTGEIIAGGTISVTTLDGGVITILKDGSTGEYSWVIDGTPGTYTMSYTPPPGYIIDPNRPVTASSFDPTGLVPDPFLLGSDDGDANGFLDDFTAGANEYYLVFELNVGDPFVELNNIPLIKKDSYANWLNFYGLGAGSDGPADNPDSDIWNNALEYALCLDPTSGVPNHLGFCVEAITSTEYDASFIRVAGGVSDVTYCIEARSSLPLNGGDTWTLLEEIPGSGTGSIAGVTVTDNGDGTETVRLADIDTTAPLTQSQGFVRLTIKLDDDGNAGTDPVESSTMVQGWQETTYTQNQCETFSYPWLKKENLSGSIASVSGNELTISGTPDLSVLLEAGKSYYLEVIEGDNAGHRFDVNSANAIGVVTLATDTELCAGPPFNTLAPIPGALVMDRFILREHHTIEGLFPAASFTAEPDPSLADRLLIYEGGTTPWKVVYVDDPAVWKDEISGNNVGTDVLPPSQGFFVHPKATAGNVTILGMGVVRENAFNCPLNGGYSLVAGGYPLDQSFDSRGLNDTDNLVVGSLDPSFADQVQFWAGDGGSPYKEVFVGHFRVEGTVPGLSAFAQWADLEDVSLTDTSLVQVFKSNRSAFYIRVDETCKEDHVMPLPWLP